MKKMLFAAILLSMLPTLVLFAETTKPSFDCTKAESDAEKLVCSNEQLALLDRELARIYSLTINSPTLDTKEKKYLRASQLGWIKGRDEAWKVKDKKRYVADVYLLRIAEIRQQHPASRATDSNGISTGPITYDCSGDRIEAYFIQADPPRAVVYHNNTPSVFTLVRSANGAKYVGEYVDGRVEFWTKGQEALFTIMDGNKLKCMEKANHSAELFSIDQVEANTRQNEDTIPTDIIWAWEISRYNNDTELKPEERSRYTLKFKGNGSFHIQADCNRVLGRYASEGNSISFVIGPSTRMDCGPDSLDQQFLKDLEGVSIWFLKNSRLYLDIKYDTGTMEFSRLLK